jgi:hypothetical protein
MPSEDLVARMASYHEELAKAGVLLDASGLPASSKGWRIKHSGNRRSVIDGPLAETKELIAGYTLIQVKWRDEALEWTQRFPNPAVDGTEGERCASCSSWKTSVRAGRWNAFARWGSRPRSSQRGLALAGLDRRGIG